MPKSHSTFIRAQVSMTQSPNANKANNLNVSRSEEQQKLMYSTCEQIPSCSQCTIYVRNLSYANTIQCVAVVSDEGNGCDTIGHMHIEERNVKFV